MTADLPEGYAWRRATPADAESIYELVSRHCTEVLGHSDVTLNDMQDDLTEPGFDLETDSWLGYAPGGVLAGFAWAIGKGNGAVVDLDVISLDNTLTAWLYDQVLARAAEMARAGGHAQCVADQGIYRQDTRGRAFAAQHGFTPHTAFHRMRIDHGSTPPNPVPPDGVTIRSGPGDEAFRRTAHALLNESFREHHAWHDRSFDDWQQIFDQERTFDWSQLTVVELDSRPVAVLITSDRFVEDENCGYVLDIGVLPEARGRGIAKYLLLAAFATDQRAGRTGTILHVDTNNVTPALGLYQSVGMRPILVIDLWRSTTST